MKEKLYKEKVSKNKTTEIYYKMHEIKPIYWFFALIYSILPPPTRRHGYDFYRRKLGLEMTSLPSSRVPLLLETTKNKGSKYTIFGTHHRPKIYTLQNMFSPRKSVQCINHATMHYPPNYNNQVDSANLHQTPTCLRIIYTTSFGTLDGSVLWMWSKFFRKIFQYVP